MSKQLIDQAKGRWRSVLVALGIPETCLTGKKGRCPICGGKDRFRFDDKGGSGSFFCNQCGSGYGIHLLQKTTGVEYAAACRMIEGVIGAIGDKEPHAGTRKPERDCVSAMLKAKEVWEGASAVTPGSRVDAYLGSRGLSPILGTTQRVVRSADRLLYLDEDGEFRGRLPAMVALIHDANRRPTGIHRTFLAADGSEKAPVPVPRKILGTLPAGSAVRLGEVGCALGIAEGIETALAASLLFKVPVWAALTAGNLESWTPPEGATEIHVFGDNDKNFAGQKAAYALAHRLSLHRFNVAVHLPEQPGTDWNDVLRGCV
ncbi:DUF7146 domain-containing protein [Sinorhizobium fredii]|uniref:DUF7146 domain-containing protein n=1 Tax=Rhizobium fredii TaxID=380 RepID=UPI00055AA830|nr:toprim domain-containing protein [Sinorhizobium fredii]